MTPTRGRTSDYETLKRLCEAATNGPWTVRLNQMGYVRFILDERNNTVAEVTGSALCKEPDAAFIAAARTAVPELLADLDRTVSTVQGLVGLLEAVSKCELCHDENGHAYLKVPARSIFDLGAQITAALDEQAQAAGGEVFTP